MTDKSEISKQSAKRLRNLNLTYINQMTDGRARTFDVMRKALDEERQKVANAASLLEAIVRRHGPQTFDRGDIETVCARGNIEFEVSQTRITVRLKSTGLSDGETRIVDPP